MKTAAPLPLDVRLMNMAAALLASVFVLLVLGGGAWWLLRHPVFAIQTITVQGEVTRNNAVTLRANVMPQLSGNFFTIDLKRARDAFEAVPWVRSAVVHRDFPNRLRAVLEEHEPMALWGDDSANKMVNQQSRVFEAVDMNIEQLELTPRGSWRVVTDRGALLELGRGSQADITAQLKVFFRTLSQVTARYGRTPTALAGADLRHKDGYALRLRGVSTVETDSKKKS